MSRLRILQFGRTGQLAQEMLARAPAHAVTLQALGRDQADLAAAESIAEIIARAEVDLVVNAAAYTAVDRAESERELAIAVNAAAPAAMARACAARGLPLVHVSTDYVFDGEKEGAWIEADPTGPVSVYGESKLEGERAILASGARAVILRTSWVFSPYGGNFVKTMLRLGRERRELRVVDDQRGCPTAAGDLAEFILAAAPRLVGDADPELFGLFHFAGDGVTTWRRFAEAIFEAARPPEPPAVLPITAAEYPTPARRPRNSELDCSRLAQIYGYRPRPWRQGLNETVAALSRPTIEA